ncbi:MAG TPA: ankyrin repeat domain-containing protein, partial [Vicinamibacteria bacterium]|nr:ankyrin repeat domain-containing protein [Vicinamibacteria bacterium]
MFEANARRGSGGGVLGLMSLAALFWAATVTPRTSPESNVADAARLSDIDEVRTLIERGADVDAAQGDGMTALHWAAKTGNVELARVLIEAGANLDAKTRIGEHRPLHVASAEGRSSVVLALLEAGCRVNETTTTGATALHFAAGSGSAEAVAILLQHGAEVNPKEPVWGQTPLMFAAAAGRTDVVEVLLEHGADPAIAAKMVDVAARNKLDRAERRERNRRVAELRSTEKDVVGQPPSTSDQARSQAIAESQREREEAEKRGNEPEPLNYADLVGMHGGLTPLLLAAREGHTESALALIKGGADINQVSRADGTSPMLIAMINGHFDLAMRLFELGADPNLASDAGATPLYAALNMHWAPKARHPQPVAYLQQKLTYMEVMETLLKAGVDPNVRLKKTLWYTTYNRDLLGVDRTGATPFWRAAYALDITAMRLLLAYGADPSLPTIKVPERRDPELGEVDDVDRSGLPPVPMGGPAVYPIHAASGVGYGQGFAGNSHRHVPDGWLPAVKFLVEELGADVNARDHNGYTPLHHAAARGDNELILYLVSKGADATALARNGQTTADMANGPVQRVQPFPETVALLEKLGSQNN